MPNFRGLLAPRSAGLLNQMTPDYWNWALGAPPVAANPAVARSDYDPNVANLNPMFANRTPGPRARGLLSRLIEPQGIEANPALENAANIQEGEFDWQRNSPTPRWGGLLSRTPEGAPEQSWLRTAAPILQSLGQSVLTSPSGIGGGIAEGLVNAPAYMAQANDRAREDYLYDTKIAELEREEAQRRRTDELFGGGTALAGSPPGSVMTPGNTQYAQAGGPTPGEIPNQLAGLVNDEQYAKLRRVYELFGADEAKKSLEQMLEPAEPAPGKVGEYLSAMERGVIPRGMPYQEYLAMDDAAPSDEQLYNKAVAQGFEGTILDFLLAQKRAGASNTSIMLPVDENAEQKAEGERRVADASTVFEAAQNAAMLLPNLRVGRQVLLNSGANMPSGAGAYLGNVATYLGFSPETVESMGLGNITDAQAFTGTMQNLVLAKMQAQKGPQTENDAKRIEATVANLGQSPEARIFLLDASIALGTRDMIQADFYREWRDSHAGSYKGADAAWNSLADQMPLMAQFNAPDGSAKTVFFNTWLEAAMKQNPGVGVEELIAEWGRKYGAR